MSAPLEHKKKTRKRSYDDDDEPRTNGHKKKPNGKGKRRSKDESSDDDEDDKDDLSDPDDDDDEDDEDDDQIDVESRRKKKRMELLKQHMELLAGDSWKFVRLESNRGMGEWSVDYNELGKLMRQIELEKVVEETSGEMGLRLLRIIKDKGKLEEKQVCPIFFSRLIYKAERGAALIMCLDRKHCPPKTKGDSLYPYRPAGTRLPPPPGSPQNRHSPSLPNILPLVPRSRAGKPIPGRRPLQSHVTPHPAHKR